MSGLKIFAGKSNEKLTRDIAAYIDRTYVGSHASSFGVLDPRRAFGDGEMYARPAESVRGKDVFVVQSTNQPDSNFKELLMLCHSMYHASAERITAVIPYVGYSRQDWKDKSRAPVTIISDAKALEAQRIHRAILLDAHSNAVTAVYMARDIITDHLWGRPVFVRYLRDHKSEWSSPRGLVVVAPDIHAGKLARGYRKNLDGLSTAIMEKRRPRPGETEVLSIIGDVSEKDVLMVDDMIDSAKTLCNAAEALRERGACSIYALATHAIFSGDAVKRIEDSIIEKVFVTDSIFHPKPFSDTTSKIVVVSVAELLGEAIWRTHADGSVSSLFDED